MKGGATRPQEKRPTGRSQWPRLATRGALDPSRGHRLPQVRERAKSRLRAGGTSLSTPRTGSGSEGDEEAPRGCSSVKHKRLSPNTQTRSSEPAEGRCWPQAPAARRWLRVAAATPTPLISEPALSAWAIACTGGTVTVNETAGSSRGLSAVCAWGVGERREVAGGQQFSCPHQSLSARAGVDAAEPRLAPQTHPKAAGSAIH